MLEYVSSLCFHRGGTADTSLKTAYTEGAKVTELAASCVWGFCFSLSWLRVAFDDDALGCAWDGAGGSSRLLFSLLLFAAATGVLLAACSEQTQSPPAARCARAVALSCSLTCKLASPGTAASG